MPSPCCVPGCTGNYKTGRKVSVYKFPQNKEEAAKWLRAIKRKNFFITPHSKVCELHFQETDFQRSCSACDEKTGKTITVEYKVPRLIKGSVPSRLPNLPSYLSASLKTVREDPVKRRKRLEDDALKIALDKSAVEKAAYDLQRTFSSLQELHCKTSYIDNTVWTFVDKEDLLVILRIVLDPVPKIECSLVIDSELSVKAYFHEQQLQKLGMHTFPLTVNHIDVLNDILQTLMTFNINKNNSRETLETVRGILRNMCVSDELSRTRIKFFEEQLSLISAKKNSFRYSSDLIIFSSLLFTMAPHAYDFIRKSGNVILPHQSTIRRVCLQFNAQPDVEKLDSNFLSYIRQKSPVLNNNDRKVLLMLDEIHLKQYLDFKGGNICGLSFNSQSMATSAHVFMVSSLLSKYKDVVHILPVKTINSDMLFNVMKKIILGLEKCGFFVVCVVTDNNSINRKCMSLLVSPPKAQIVYPHPADSSRPLFYVVDTVHLFKCIRNNWLNQKNSEKCMYFPRFESSEGCSFQTASWQTLKDLHKAEVNSLVKYGFNLSYKALNPTNIERQNVKLVTQIFNDFVVNGLLEIGQNNKLLHYQDTSDFIKIIVTWWQIVNVKTPIKGVRLNNEYQTPLTFLEEDKKVIFLYSFLDWLDAWENMGCTTGMLSKETHSALKLSTYALLELTSYCTTELNFSYILPGKIQTDDLESRFGLYRQLAGSQYNISVRQLFETETKLRVQSLLKLPTKSNGEIKITDLEFKQNFDEINLKSVCDSVFPISVIPSDIDACTEYLPVLTYIAGYCVFCVIKKFKCDFCKQILLLDKKVELNVHYKYFKKLDRGSLCCPTDGVINAVVFTYVVVKKLCTEFEDIFVNMPNQRNIVTLISRNTLEFEELFDDVMSCESGHCMDKILDMIIWSSTNIFLNNYCKIKNDTHSRNSDNKKNYFSDKKRKLSTFMQ